MAAEYTIQDMEKHLIEAFELFQRDNPEVAEAMDVMGVSFHDYMVAMASLKENSSTTGDASSR